MDKAQSTGEGLIGVAIIKLLLTLLTVVFLVIFVAQIVLFFSTKPDPDMNSLKTMRMEILQGQYVLAKSGKSSYTSTFPFSLQSSSDVHKAIIVQGTNPIKLCLLAKKVSDIDIEKITPRELFRADDKNCVALDSSITAISVSSYNVCESGECTSNIFAKSMYADKVLIHPYPLNMNYDLIIEKQSGGTFVRIQPAITSLITINELNEQMSKNFQKTRGGSVTTKLDVGDLVGVGRIYRVEDLKEYIFYYSINDKVMVVYDKAMGITSNSPNSGFGGDIKRTATKSFQEEYNVNSVVEGKTIASVFNSPLANNRYREYLDSNNKVLGFYDTTTRISYIFGDPLE